MQGESLDAPDGCGRPETVITINGVDNGFLISCRVGGYSRTFVVQSIGQTADELEPVFDAIDQFWRTIFHRMTHPS